MESRQDITVDPGGTRGLILDTVVLIVTDALARERLTLRAPVEARFTSGESGSTGVELDIRLDDPRNADAAKASIVERFGSDPLTQVNVS